MLFEIVLLLRHHYSISRDRYGCNLEKYGQIELRRTVRKRCRLSMRSFAFYAFANTRTLKKYHKRERPLISPINKLPPLQIKQHRPASSPEFSPFPPKLPLPIPNHGLRSRAPTISPPPSPTPSHRTPASLPRNLPYPMKLLYKTRNSYICPLPLSPLPTPAYPSTVKPANLFHFIPSVIGKKVPAPGQSFD